MPTVHVHVGVWWEKFELEHQRTTTPLAVKIHAGISKYNFSIYFLQEQFVQLFNCLMAIGAYLHSSNLT